MPKKDGVNKTYSFNKETVRKLDAICKKGKRTATNYIEVLVDKEFDDIFRIKKEITDNGKREKPKTI